MAQAVSTDNADRKSRQRLAGDRRPESAEPKHTPGPWDHTKSGKLPIYIGAQDGRWKDAAGTIIATVGDILAVGTGNFAEDIANARLISIAPELFKWAELFEKTIEYEILVSRNGGDEEGARLKTLTLNLLRADLAKVRSV